MVLVMNIFQEPEGTPGVVNLPALLLRALPLPTPREGQTRRPTVQNGGIARNGLKEVGLMNIKNGMLITTASNVYASIFRVETLLFD